jgi:hypothetical protein
MAQNRALSLGGIGSPCCCTTGPPPTPCTSVQNCCSVCNWGVVFPTLTFTDSLGTAICLWNGTRWEGCYAVSSTTATPSSTACNCASTPSGGSGTLVNVAIECDSAGNINVLRSYTLCPGSDTFCLSTYDATTCQTTVEFCGISCGSACVATASIPALNCNPFPLSVSLTPAAGSCSTTDMIFGNSATVDS